MKAVSELPDRIGRYRITRSLGEGGMGRVFAAELEGPAGFRKAVAIKVLKGGGDGLVREAKLGGLLRHPNLVEVYALEETEEGWLVAMELVPDGSLVGKAPLPPRAVVEIGLQVCAGLAHAHEAIGLVHMDLKPSNLLLHGATVKIADLGIARARGFDDGTIRGTPAYMAPEQARGAAVDGRADVWSLGVVLHELASGTRPPRPSDDTWSTLDGPAPGGVTAPTIARVPWLAPVLARCLAVDPAARFASASELASALRAVVVDGPGLAEALGIAPTLTLDPPTERARTNLAGPPDAFVGRSAELAALFDQVDACRLVTLKALGGVGKTRLSREFARTWHQRTHQAAWFCDLSDARSALDAVGEVAQVLDLPLGRGDAAALAAEVGRALAARGPALVVLDNLEQVLEIGPIVARWLAAAPEVRWIATTREALRIRGERVVELGPLPTADAVALLVARVEARGRDLVVDAALTRLAERLDGIPLAIELAAGRLGVLSAEQLLARLDRQLDLLRDARQGAPDRQATLRGMVDWSWELLEPAHRSALAQLTVFRGGFTLEAAEAVLALDDPGLWAMDAVAALVDRSLIAAQPVEGEPRFGMFEAVRAYAAERLEPTERAAAEARHGAWFAGLAGGDTVHRIDEADGGALLLRLYAELDNLEVGCRRAIRDGRLDEGAAMLRGAWEVWRRRGPVAVAAALFEDVLQGLEGASPAVRSEMHEIAAQVLLRAGRMRDAIEHADLALALAATPGRQMSALHQQAALRVEAGDLSGARPLLEQALALATPESPRPLAAAGADVALGLLRMRLGEVEQGRDHLDRALAVYRARGNQRREGSVLGHLGVLAYERGRLVEAVEHLERAVSLAVRFADLGREAVLRQNLGMALLELGRVEGARRNLGRALRLHRDVGSRRSEAAVAVTLVALELRTGDLLAAEDEVAAALAAVQAGGGPVWAAILDGWRGQLAIEQGRARDALALLDRAVEGLAGRFEQAAGYFRAVRGAARVAAGEPGGHEDLDAAVAALEAGGYATDLVRALIWRARALGDVASRDGAVARMDALGLPDEALMRREVAAAQIETEPRRS